MPGECGSACVRPGRRDLGCQAGVRSLVLRTSWGEDAPGDSLPQSTVKALHWCQSSGFPSTRILSYACCDTLCRRFCVRRTGYPFNSFVLHLVFFLRSAPC